MVLLKVQLSGFCRPQNGHWLNAASRYGIVVICDVKDGALILTGKLFEYLASGTEMLSIGPVNGNAAAILKQTGRKPMLAFSNGEEIKKKAIGGCH